MKIYWKVVHNNRLINIFEFWQYYVIFDTVTRDDGYVMSSNWIHKNLSGRKSINKPEILKFYNRMPFKKF